MHFFSTQTVHFIIENRMKRGRVEQRTYEHNNNFAKNILFCLAAIFECTEYKQNERLLYLTHKMFFVARKIYKKPKS